jgi:hypothetical protein
MVSLFGKTRRLPSLFQSKRADADHDHHRHRCRHRNLHHQGLQQQDQHQQEGPGHEGREPPALAVVDVDHALAELIQATRA